MNNDIEIILKFDEEEIKVLKDIQQILNNGGVTPLNLYLKLVNNKRVLDVFSKISAQVDKQI